MGSLRKLPEGPGGRERRTRGPVEVGMPVRLCLVALAAALGGCLPALPSVAPGDGEQHERTWTFERLGPGRLGGTLSDAVGPVEATVEGPRLTLRYPMGGGLAMTQRLTLSPDGRSARNLATVRWQGVPVARLDETIRRRGPAAAPSARLQGDPPVRPNR